MKKILITMLLLTVFVGAFAQLPKVYDEKIDPMAQIDEALATASASDKYVVCQVGGNWCPWCLKFADYITKDEEINKTVSENFVYIHVNYPKDGGELLIKRLHNPARFGFPVLVILNDKGDVIHIQDSGLLEEGSSYNHDKVLRFFQCWTKKAVE